MFVTRWRATKPPNDSLDDDMRWIITGGAGFIGCNTAHRLGKLGHDVIVFDNLSRSGSEENLRWLEKHTAITFIKGDVRNSEDLARALAATPRADVVLHLAGQVAVTTSVMDPRFDFEVNAAGTFNLCEAVRQVSPETILLNASTNKVYGSLARLATEKFDKRFRFAGKLTGVSEEQPVDFHSPYGCSKGIGDAYVHDYARIYGLRTVNLRQSCIYGTRQFGVEDQGWVAWFAIAAMLGRPITIFGDGHQTRDVLFVDDLIDCYLAAVDRIDDAAGETFNVGGGPANTLSLLELLEMLESRVRQPLDVSYASTRDGDQPLFVCDLGKAQKKLGWRPRVGVAEGVDRLLKWIAENRRAVEMVVPSPART
jgi:CDP-paratose 2-epimerase